MKTLRQNKQDKYHRYADFEGAYSSTARAIMTSIKNLFDEYNIQTFGSYCDTDGCWYDYVEDVLPICYFEFEDEDERDYGSLWERWEAADNEARQEFCNRLFECLCKLDLFIDSVRSDIKEGKTFETICDEYESGYYPIVFTEEDIYNIVKELGGIKNESKR